MIDWQCVTLLAFGSHDDQRCPRGFQAMEEGVNGDVNGASASCGKVEASARWDRVSVFAWFGCSRSSLSTSTWANLTGFWVYDTSGIISDLMRDFLLLQWTFHPFVYHSKRFYTVLLWRRVLAFLVVACLIQGSQVLRILTFYSTQLPGPNYHCREGSELARLPPPQSISEVLLLNFPQGMIYGCGDLIFSSHMIFTLVFVLTYQKYGSKRLMKILAWTLAVVQSLLIVASRKHYTVDVVVAWYSVNLVVFFVNKKLPEMPDRSSLSLPLIQSSTKEKDGRSKEELLKLLNGNSADTADRRQRSQSNGKHLENGNHILSEAMMNGAKV
ncbi:hypothetical protein ZIOFF_047219 [Zingiber officinale]|uniref:Sphingomyelin synthase-like domain-containing protein n=1 Tax=Zingiber officinale TaxID=94328 RepID=A0A8J5G5T6_ZINOF|nr:hypothetical protein ZIOFF_047219 [Zingiber officinale]